MTFLTHGGTPIMVARSKEVGTSSFPLKKQVNAYIYMEILHD